MNQTQTLPVCKGARQERHWYVIYTRSRFEKKVQQALKRSNFQTYLPLIKEKRRWSDRIKTVEMPLFPSYVFIHSNPVNFPQVYLIPGFVRFVSFEGKPCIINSKEIDLINQIISLGLPVQRKAICCKAGDQVRVVSGPFQGWQGQVERTSGQSRIVFQFDCINQGVSVEVNMADVEMI